jgi:hypothetical protein
MIYCHLCQPPIFAAPSPDPQDLPDEWPDGPQPALHLRAEPNRHTPVYEGYLQDLSADREVRDPEDPDYKDKMSKNKARTGSAAGKPSS